MKYSILLILICAFTAFGQAAKLTTPHQKVVIEKTNGDRLTGLFVGGNTDSAIIEISGTKIPIPFQEIKLIWIGDAKAEIAATQMPSVNYVANAVRFLKQLAAATDVGVSFQDYNRRLIDVKAQISDVLPNIVDENAKNEIKLAMDAYADAATAWNFANQNRGYLFTNFEPSITLRPKYNLPVIQMRDLTLITKDAALSTIWAAAQKHLNLAESTKADSSKPVSEGSASITGLWKIIAAYNGQSLSFDMVITHQGESYFASLQSSDFNTPKTLMNINGSSFMVSYSDKEASQSGTIAFEGVFENNGIKGTLKLTQGNQSGSAPFTGLR